MQNRRDAIYMTSLQEWTNQRRRHIMTSLYRKFMDKSFAIGIKLFLLLFCFCCFHFAQADIPFRNHRFDSWTGLEMPKDAIVFVGNSITDMHNWGEAFGSDPRIVNRGNSGALSGEVLQNAMSWLQYHPAKVFLMIGTNDLGSDTSEYAIVKNISALVKLVRKESPQTQLYLQSILPARDQKLRTLQTIQATNKMIRELAEHTPNTTYIDLYPTFLPILDNKVYSLDQLHLTAYGYKLWCDIISPYVGLNSVYPDDADILQQDAGLWGSHGMRATYFSLLPIQDDDILFFGDEMVKNGEWAELLHDTHVKNRGTGWGYGGSIALTSAMVDATFPGKTERPKTVLLYTATDDVNGDMDLVEVELKYENLLKQIHNVAPDAQIVVLTLMPTNNNNPRIVEFNNWLQMLAETDSNLKVLDIYAMLALDDGLPNPEYIKENYLYAKGYRVVADAIAKML